ncbi:hypothetical protein J4410_01050 [Candidatus Woesearchaeota archaeon]|nr:hypothetical protein [Candidatus Woesearchaeota archaeon]
MEERTLFGIALICLLLGLPALWILSVTLDLEEKDVIFLEEEQTAKVQGKITKITQKEDLTILEVEHRTKVPVIIFDEIQLEEGTFIEAIGKVETYKGKKEVLANEIRRLEKR